MRPRAFLIFCFRTESKLEFSIGGMQKFAPRSDSRAFLHLRSLPWLSNRGRREPGFVRFCVCLVVKVPTGSFYFRTQFETEPGT